MNLTAMKLGEIKTKELGGETMTTAQIERAMKKMASSNTKWNTTHPRAQELRRMETMDYDAAKNSETLSSPAHTHQSMEHPTRTPRRPAETATVLQQNQQQITDQRNTAENSTM